MKKFEYKRIRLSNQRSEYLFDELNELGNNGWEIIYYSEHVKQDVLHVVAVLKREKQ